MNWLRFIGKVRSGLHIAQSKIHPSYSQAGEDQVIRYLMECLKIPNPTYLDIGTNHPFIGNNTYYFYNRGCEGVCIEPDFSLYTLIAKVRNRDKVLHAGVGLDDTTEAELFVFPHPYSGWNTFSKTEAETRQKETGINVSHVARVPLVSINQVMADHFERWPNLISLDVEGLDFLILQSIDFQRFRPEVICVETITFSMDHKEEKVSGINEFMLSRGYFAFADTHINTVFCRQDIYNASK